MTGCAACGTGWPRGPRSARSSRARHHMLTRGKRGMPACYRPTGTHPVDPEFIGDEAELLRWRPLAGSGAATTPRQCTDCD